MNKMFRALMSVLFAALLIGVLSTFQTFRATAQSIYAAFFPVQGLFSSPSLQTINATGYLQHSNGVLVVSCGTNNVFVHSNGLAYFVNNASGNGWFTDTNGKPGIVTSGTFFTGFSSNVVVTNATGTRTLLITNGVLLGVN